MRGIALFARMGGPAQPSCDCNAVKVMLPPHPFKGVSVAIGAVSTLRAQCALLAIALMHGAQPAIKNALLNPRPAHEVPRTV